MILRPGAIAASLEFLAGGGECGAIIRGLDWTATPLGAPALWPPALRTLVGVMLQSGQPMLIVWGHARTTLYNDGYALMCGARHPAAMGRSFDDLWFDIWDQVEPIIACAYAGEPTSMDDIEFVMHRNGYPEETHFAFSYTPVRGEDGVVAGMFCACTETTDQVQARREVAAAAARQAFLVGFSDALGGLSDPRAVMRAAAERVGRHWGVGRCGFAEIDAEGELFTVETDWTDGAMASFVGAWRLADFGEPLIAALRTGRTVALDDPFTDALTAGAAAAHVGSGGLRASLTSPLVKDGRFVAAFYLHQTAPRRWTMEDEELVRAAAERTWAAVERARAQTALRDSQHELALLTDALPVLISYVDAEQRYRFNNRAYEDWFGHDRQALGGRTVREVIGDAAYADLRPQIEAALAGRRFSSEQRVPYRHGGARDVHVEYVPRTDPTGRTEGYYALIQDVSDRKAAERALQDLNETLETRVAERTAELQQAQDALRQSQKLEAIGQLTGGVAHDFNNLLTVIRGSVDLLRRPDLAEDRRRRYIDAISDTVNRAAKLTSQLLAFARRQALKPEVFDVGRSVVAVGEMIGTLTGSRIVVEVSTPEHAAFVNADPSQFDTALVNLAVNARDAMDGEGRLTIGVVAATGIPDVRGHPAVAGDFVAVSVTDTGAGMPPEMLDKIFEPFFTTKATGHGTGLGLSQVFGFSKQSGGEVEVRSTLGEGSVFTLFLPRVAAPSPSAVQDRMVEAAADGGGLCILVVEDNADVGVFATQTLRELGYDTVLAVNAEDALARLADGASRFDAVFSDVVMPGMSGIELGREIRRLHDGLPVILTSGYSHVLAQDGPDGFELLHKPYSIEALSRVLRKTVAQRWRPS